MVSTWNRTESEQTRTRSESMRCERATVACDRGSEKAEACLTGRATDSQINATNSGCYARSGKRRSVIGVVMLSRRRGAVFGDERETWLAGIHDDSGKENA
jgi:hypothetical protein